MSVDPRGLTLTQWADAVILTVPDAFAFGRLDDEARWRDFAVTLLRAPTFGQRAIPDPYGFSDWREWAQRVYPMLEVR